MPVSFPNLKGLFNDEAEVDNPLSMKPKSIAFGASHDAFHQHFKLLKDQLILLVILIFQLFIHYVRQYFSAVVPQSLEVWGQKGEFLSLV